MNRDNIIKLLNQYNFNKSEFIVISGAALVLYGIKDMTNDIDIAVSENLYKEILDNYDCEFEIEINNNKVWFIDNILNFSRNHFDDSEYNLIEGYMVQSLNSIIELKKTLNRDKDIEDIKKIKEFLKSTH